MGPVVASRLENWYGEDAGVTDGLAVGRTDGFVAGGTVEAAVGAKNGGVQSPIPGTMNQRACRLQQDRKRR